MEPKISSNRSEQEGYSAFPGRRRLDWTPAFTTAAILGLCFLFTVSLSGTDEQAIGGQSEQATGDGNAPQNDRRVPVIFTFIALVGATATQIIRNGIQSLHHVVPPDSSVADALDSRCWAEIVSPVALSFYSASLIETMTSYLDDAEAICGSRRISTRTWPWATGSIMTKPPESGSLTSLSALWRLAFCCISGPNPGLGPGQVRDGSFYIPRHLWAP
jgi:hypothetical protein